MSNSIVNLFFTVLYFVYLTTTQSLFIQGVRKVTIQSMYGFFAIVYVWQKKAQ